MAHKMLLLSCALTALIANAQMTYSPNITTTLNVNASGSINTLDPGQNTSNTILEYFANRLSLTSAPGGALLLTVPGRGELLQSFGVQSLNSSDLFDLNNHFRIASNTKTFTGSAILKLISEGSLSLNDTWSKFYDGSQGTFPYADNITVEDMLAMKSGVYDYVYSQAYLEGPNVDPTTALNDSQVITAILSGQPYFAPGQTQYFNYSNSNYFMLGQIIKNITNMTDADYVVANLVQPLNLTETSWPSNFTLPSPSSQGYAFFPYNETTAIVDSTLYNPANAGAAGAMVSTLYNLKTWVENLMQGYGYNSQLSAQRLSPGLPLQNIPIGLALNITYSLAAIEMNGYYGHDGGIKGFSTIMFSHPKKNITVTGVASLGADAGQGSISLGEAIGILRIVDPDSFPIAGM